MTYQLVSIARDPTNKLICIWLDLTYLETFSLSRARTNDIHNHAASFWNRVFVNKINSLWYIVINLLWGPSWVEWEEWWVYWLAETYQKKKKLIIAKIKVWLVETLPRYQLVLSLRHDLNDDSIKYNFFLHPWSLMWVKNKDFFQEQEIMIFFFYCCRISQHFSDGKGNKRIGNKSDGSTAWST